MIADSWNTLLLKNLRNAWNKLLGKESEIEQKEMEEELNEIEKLIPQIPRFDECDEADIAEWLNIDKDPGYKILDEDEIVNLVQSISM